MSARRPVDAPAVWRRVSSMSAHELDELRTDFDLPCDDGDIVVVLSADDVACLRRAHGWSFKGAHWRDAVRE